MNTENLSLGKKVVVGIQFLFVAFGATVLVPILVGIDPATALLTAGLGTFIFHFVTKGRVPIFLGSSFAFIAPINVASEQWGLGGALAGLTAVSVVYFGMSALIKWQGRKLLNRIFPPVVIGPVIILIGLSLSETAVNMAKSDWLLAFSSLFTAILVLTFGKGLMKLVPIISGVVAASWFSFPVKFDTITHFSWAPFLYMLPVAIAPVLEHIGDVYVVSAVAKKEFVVNPGLHRTMLGDGLACLASAFLGGPPETTYSEVTGAMSITKVTSPAVIRISAATALFFSVIGKLSALLQSIPKAVLGGIMLLLFGTIASVGIQNMMQRKVDMNDTRNIIIISVMLTMGLGGAVLSSGNFAISGIGLSAIVGVVLNLVLPKMKKTEEKKAE